MSNGKIPRARLHQFKQAKPKPPIDQYQAKLERGRFYVSPKWTRLRDLKRQLTPLCEQCQREGELSATEAIHHKIDRLKRPDLAYDLENLESLCYTHHAIVTNDRRPKRRGQ